MPYVLSDDDLVELWPAIKHLNGVALIERLRTETDAARRRKFKPEGHQVTIIRLLEIVDWAASQRGLANVPATPLAASAALDELINVGWVTRVSNGYVAAVDALTYARADKP